MAISNGEPPEPLFLDYPVSHVLDPNIRIPRVEPYASQYCAAIADQRYGDAIWARYHMDGAGQLTTEEGSQYHLRMTEDGSSIETVQVSVYEMIMDDARGYARDSPDLFREALILYNNGSPRDGRRDIIEGLARIGVGSNLVTRAFASVRGMLGLS